MKTQIELEDSKSLLKDYLLTQGQVPIPLEVGKGCDRVKLF